MYQALYRKYRPKNFEDVVGQVPIIKTLKNSIVNNRFSHAYLFFGPRGTGKTTISKIFARAVNCENNNNGDACGNCDKCNHSFDKECVDIIEIDAASNNGVDEIRELRNKVSLVPSMLKYKIYIIDEVHMLSIGAFNALLKTLEEPPEHVIFILATTDYQKVPETIISRCQCFNFEKISNNNLFNRLKYITDVEKINIDDEVLDQIAKNSDGGLRDAIGLLDKLSSFSSDKITIDDFYSINGLITLTEINNFCIYIFNNDVSSVLKMVEEFDDRGKNLSQIIVQIIYYLRNVMVDYYVNNIKPKYDIKLIVELINLFNTNLSNIRKSENAKINIEMLILNYINNSLSSSNNNNVNDDNINNIKHSQTNVRDNYKASKDNKIVNNNDMNNDMIIQINNENKNIDSDNSLIKENNGYSKKSNDKLKNKVISSNLPLNFEEILSTRLNNTFAKANKQLLIEEQDKFKSLNDYIYDQQIGYIINELLDAKICMVSDENIVLSYEYQSAVNQNLDNIKNITDIYNKITNSNKSFVILSNEKWNEEKNKFISNLKSGVKYNFVEEPEEVFEVQENNDIINNDTINLFENVVEFE